MGFPGHLWSHGLNYRPVEVKMTDLMNSETGWQDLAKELGVDYLFWGPFEAANYPDSQKEWEKNCPVVAEGPWGRIYDLRGLIAQKRVARRSGRSATACTDVRRSQRESSAGQRTSARDGVQRSERRSALTAVRDVPFADTPIRFSRGRIMSCFRCAFCLT